MTNHHRYREHSTASQAGPPADGAYHVEIGLMMYSAASAQCLRGAQQEERTYGCEVEPGRLIRTRPPSTTSDGVVEELKKLENMVVVRK